MLILLFRAIMVFLVESMIAVLNSQTTPVLTTLTIHTQLTDKRISSSQIIRVFKITSHNSMLVDKIKIINLKIGPISLSIGILIDTWWIQYISQGKLWRHFKCINTQACHGEEEQVRLTTSTLIFSRCRQILHRITINNMRVRCRIIWILTKLWILILTLL